MTDMKSLAVSHGFKGSLRALSKACMHVHRTFMSETDKTVAFLQSNYQLSRATLQLLSCSARVDWHYWLRCSPRRGLLLPHPHTHEATVCLLQYHCQENPIALKFLLQLRTPPPPPQKECHGPVYLHNLYKPLSRLSPPAHCLWGSACRSVTVS